ncbi:hypothetical protein [Ureaplasma ceti]|uniref:Uncharacterized protein n=1 Tax=Ureaplasma ceti TaxID=3119530 RepID=A0ABP9U4N9_9BACT
MEQFSYEDFKEACNNQGLSGRAQMIDVYLAALNTYKDKLTHINPSIAITKNNLETMIENSNDWILIGEFLEDNIGSYMTKPSDKELDMLRYEGLLLADQITAEEDNVFPDKKVLLQITEQNFDVHKQKTLRMDFNLLDTLRRKWEDEVHKDNVSSVIDAMDKTTYLFKNVDIRKQTQKEDQLFAVISIDDTPYNLCEHGMTWLLNTGWTYNFIKVNDTLKAFYKKHNLSYHFSYEISLDNLNYGLREANGSISDLYLRIKQVKSKYDVSLLNKLEREDMSFFKRLTMSEKKMNKEVLYLITSILDANKDLMESLAHKLSFLRKAIILNDLKDNRVGE